jgi:hypothetical protein
MVEAPGSFVGQQFLCGNGAAVAAALQFAAQQHFTKAATLICASS